MIGEDGSRSASRRPVSIEDWESAAGAGVHEVLANLLADIDSVLALAGYQSLAELDHGPLDPAPA